MPGTSLAAPGNRSFWRLPVMLEGGFNFLVAVDLEEAEQRARSQEAWLECQDLQNPSNRANAAAEQALSSPWGTGRHM
jgi:hypothetical protein